MRTLGIFALFVLFVVSNSLEINCKFYEDDWAVIGRLYSCSVKNLHARLPVENVTNILGTHEEQKTNKDVKKINIQNQDCEFLPRGFDTFFPEIEGLRVAQSGLVSLRQSDLKVFPKLRSVDMFNNALMTLDANLFTLNPHIEYLYFGDNKIHWLGYNLLAPLKKLSVAVFQGNSCVSKNFRSPKGDSLSAFQTELNDECRAPLKLSSTPNFFSSDRRDRMLEILKEIELLEEKEKEELRNLEASNFEEKHLKNSTNPYLWALLVPFLILVSAGAYFFMKKKNIIKNEDNESIIGSLPAYSEMMKDENFTTGEDNV